MAWTMPLPHALVRCLPAAPRRARRERSCDTHWSSWLALFVLCISLPARAAIDIDVVSSEPAPVAGGDAFAYTITLTNLVAAVPSPRVWMVDPLPPQARFLGVSITGSSAGSFACTGPVLGRNGTVSCEAASMPGSGVATITIVADFAPETSDGSVRLNAARVVSGAVANTDVVQQIVTNDASTPSLTRINGTSGEYSIRRITVVNAGDSSRPDALLVEALPGGATFVSVQGTGPLAGNCAYDPPTNTVLCAVDALPSGTWQVTIVYTREDGVFRDGFE